MERVSAATDTTSHPQPFVKDRSDFFPPRLNTDSRCIAFILRRTLADEDDGKMMKRRNSGLN
jgi:hypothetical protein